MLDDGIAGGAGGAAGSLTSEVIGGGTNAFRRLFKAGSDFISTLVNEGTAVATDEATCSPDGDEGPCK